MQYAIQQFVRHVKSGNLSSGRAVKTIQILIEYLLQENSDPFQKDNSGW